MHTVRRALTSRPALVALATLLAVGAVGCDDAATAPRPAGSVVLPPGNATYRWNEIARNLLVKHRPNNPAAFRVFAYLTMAQHAAAVAAEGRDVRSVPGAVAGASAAVLAYAFPAEAPALDSIVRHEERLLAAANPGEEPESPWSTFEAGESVGRDAASGVLARARNDRFDVAFAGEIPVGPGLWVRTAPPLMPALGGMRPFFLASGSQFRPAPPPTFGSAAFNAALAEVRQVARTRTPEQVRVAQAWALPGGSILPAGWWNQKGVELAMRHGLSDRGTARVLALMHGAMMDATIAVHDAKYTYWYIRPSQADTTIALAIGMPAHPSYPSNHTAASVAAAEVLGAFFTAEAPELDAIAEEAGLSRLYGGIHYRFDIDAGAELGSKIARAALVVGRLGSAAAPGTR